MNASPTTESTATAIRVWDVPTRIFHWSLAATFVIAFLTAEEEQFPSVHLVSGYLFAALIAFRLIWGLVGSRYARFSEFIRSPAATFDYLRSWIKGKPAHFIGHNPLGAMAILLMLALGTGLAITGWLNLGEGSGEAFEEAHEFFANAMLAVVTIHIVGVIVSSRLHRENLALAMVTGRKSGPREAEAPNRHGIIAALLIGALATFGWSLSQGRLPSLLDPATVSADKADAEDAGSTDSDD